MATGSPMAAKTAKARKMSMLEMREIQSYGDRADYRRGRYGTKPLLTPTEQWAIRRGYIQNPMRTRKKVIKDPRKSAVYYADGKRRVFLRSEDAYENFESRNDAVKLWDGADGRYLMR